MVRPILIIAWKEFRDSISNRWFLVLSAIFFLLILQIPYIILAILGLFPLANIPAKIGTFLTGAISFGALITVIIGSFGISSEKEQGTLTFLLSQPVRRIEVLFGKFFGLLISISMIMIIGFSFALLPSLNGLNAPELGLRDFSLGIFTMIMLVAVMLSISLAVSVISFNRAMAVSGALFIWLFFNVIYDSGLLSLALITSGETQSILYFILFNPIQVSQIMAYILINPSFPPGLEVQFIRQAFGSSSFTLLSVSLILWIIITMGLSTLEFYSRDY